MIAGPRVAVGVTPLASLSIVILGGLLTSTFLNLIVVPRRPRRIRRAAPLATPAH